MNLNLNLLVLYHEQSLNFRFFNWKVRLIALKKDLVRIKEVICGKCFINSWYSLNDNLEKSHFIKEEEGMLN